MNCKHSFHDKCITEWIFRNPNCPNCRACVLDNDRLSKLRIFRLEEKEVPHMLALLDDLMRAQGHEQPYSIEDIEAQVGEDNFVELLCNTNMKYLTAFDVAPLIEWQVEPSPETRVENFMKYMEVFIGFKKIIAANKKMYQEDGDSLIRALKQPRVKMSAIENFPAIYAIIDYILREEGRLANAPEISTPLSDIDLESILNRWRFPFRVDVSKHISKHKQLLTKRDFEMLMGMRRIVYTPPEIPSNTWIVNCSTWRVVYPFTATFDSEAPLFSTM